LGLRALVTGSEMAGDSVRSLSLQNWFPNCVRNNL